MTRSIVHGPGIDIDFGNNKLTNLADGVAADDAATVGQVAAGGAVSSVFGRTGAVAAATNDYSEAQLSFTDITTNNVSTSKHGFAPKGDGTTTKFLNANGAYSTPSGGSTWSVLTDGVVAGPALIFAAGDVIMVQT